jgi:hypothetical protein
VELKKSVTFASPIGRRGGKKAEKRGVSREASFHFRVGKFIEARVAGQSNRPRQGDKL